MRQSCSAVSVLWHWDMATLLRTSAGLPLVLNFTLSMQTFFFLEWESSLLSNIIHDFHFHLHLRIRYTEMLYSLVIYIIISQDMI